MAHQPGGHEQERRIEWIPIGWGCHRNRQYRGRATHHQSPGDACLDSGPRLRRLALRNVAESRSRARGELLGVEVAHYDYARIARLEMGVPVRNRVGRL